MPNPAPADDDESTLLERVRAGDEAAFGVLFRTYRRPMVKFAYRYLGTVARAEEIVQQIWADFWKLRQTLTLQAGLRSYLFGAVRNRCHRAWQSGRHERTWDEVLREAKNRGHARRTVQSASQHADFAGPTVWNEGEALVLQSELLAIIAAAVHALPEPERTVIRLARSQEMKYSDIASVLGMTRNRVRQHIVSANMKIDDHLEGAGWPRLMQRRRSVNDTQSDSDRREGRRGQGSVDEQQENRHDG